MSESVARRVPWTTTSAEERELLLAREWLTTNGLGGYASGTLAGTLTRRYHGVLVSALPAPFGRTVMVSHLAEQVRLPGGRVVTLTAEERIGQPLALDGLRYLADFTLESGFPVWRYEIEPFVLEKRLVMPYRQNTTFVTYRVLEGPGTLRVRIRPSVHFRPHNTPVSEPLATPYTLTVVEDRYELASRSELPPLRMAVRGERPGFVVAPQTTTGVVYRVEASRGYEGAGDLWSPGYFRADLAAGDDVTIVASSESWEIVSALDDETAFRGERERIGRLLAGAQPAAHEGPGAELVIAADQFIITPEGRVEDAARARAAGDEIRSVIAGYPWFTDWGRDTMIALEGLTLVTGRHVEAAYILRTFAHHVREGLIPNLFPEGDTEGLYHTADATLWFFHALDRYVAATGDRRTLTRLLPTLEDIVERHVVGTRFGIGVDPEDGLLRQGQKGYQLTWMDAKVGDWVVTPRRGKAVEINALWYNALRLLERWIADEPAGLAKRYGDAAERVYRAFNDRFWYAEGGYCYDVVDGEAGDDAACRPNQLLAISLPHPVLSPDRWRGVLDVTRERLLTPVGLRSLAPGHPEYRARYDGDLRARDAAYHQGTVWAWLIGPFVDAWLRVHRDDRAGARRFLEGFVPHLNEGCVGSISEIFDAEPPYTPRGCFAQAWSVAEVLRCWVKTAS